MTMWQITSWWNVISVVSSVIAAGGIVFVFKQVELLKEQNRINAFSSLLQQWGGKEERKARRYVLKEFEFDIGNKIEELDDDHLDKVELALAICARTSFLALNGFLRENDVLEFVGHSMLRVWSKTEQFIKARRRRDGEPEEGKRGCYMYPFQQFIEKNKKELEAISYNKGIGKSDDNK
jgi:hypothetical protein